MRGNYTLYALRYTLCVSAIALLSGCVVRSYPVTRDRVDQELSFGNQGFVQGEAPETQMSTERKLTRTTQVVEIELHPPIRFESSPKTKAFTTKEEPVMEREDSELWGNRGYITKSPISQSSALPTVITSASDAKQYIVKKGDTLQKISKKFFGTTKKWPKLYDVNKDVLKGPNKLYPGQVLTIPFDYSAPSVEKEAMEEPLENLK